MFSDIGASSAAGEILALIAKLKETYENNPDVLEALTIVEMKAQEIKTSADAGWY